MTNLNLVLAALYVLVNLLAFVLMAVDKAKARRGAWRIPERTLLAACACFGAVGGYAGMQVFRHKTQHRKFTITVPVLMIIQLALVALYCVKVAA